MAVRPADEGSLYLHIPSVRKHILPDTGSPVRLWRQIRSVGHLIDQASVVDLRKTLLGIMKMQQKSLLSRHTHLHHNLLHVLRHQHHGQTVSVRRHRLGIILLRLKHGGAHTALRVRTVREKRSVEHFRDMLIGLVEQPL